MPAGRRRPSRSLTVMGADFFPERAMAGEAGDTPISLPVANRWGTLAPKPELRRWP
ncbi:hypothetical protein BN126380020 [Stenotrophomonas thermophila]|nr:hypothetical protein BN126380020 [Stenotrophomonas maltophilia]